MKDLNIAFVTHTWVLTVTLNDGTIEEFKYGEDVSLESAVAETRALVALKEKQATSPAHSLSNPGNLKAVEALEKKLRPKG